MIAVHPTASAGDGRQIPQSLYIKKSDKRENIIACAQCGFLVDLTKRAIGDSLGAIGNPTPNGGATFLVPSPPLAVGTLLTPAPAGFEGSGVGFPHGGVRGVQMTDYFADPVDTNAGCPFCNSMNPQARGRGQTGFDRSRRSLENL